MLIVGSCVGGVESNGMLYDITTFDRGIGGSISVYAVSKDVSAAKFDTITGVVTYPGTSFAAPAVAGLAAYFASLPSLADQFPDHSVATAMKQYIIRHAYQRTANPIPANLPQAYNPAPRPESIIVAYNRAPDGLCSAHAPAKRQIRKERSLRNIKRQDNDDFDVVVSGTIVATSLSQSYCAATPTITKPASTSDFGTLTGLPTLTAASYCTEILSNGHEVLHTKTGSMCNYNTVAPTTTTTSESNPTPTYVQQGILTCQTRTDYRNDAYFYDLGEMSDARIQFCKNMTTADPPIVMKPGSQVWKVGEYIPPNNVDNPITVSAKWGAVDDSGCPTLDFGSEKVNDDGMSPFDVCFWRLNVPVDQCKLPTIFPNAQLCVTAADLLF
jgi:hypothetical protein